LRRLLLAENRITAGICDRRNGVYGSVCTAAILASSASGSELRGVANGLWPHSKKFSGAFSAPAGQNRSLGMRTFSGKTAALVRIRKAIQLCRPALHTVP
jgi:hypothetical protein